MEPSDEVGSDTIGPLGGDDDGRVWAARCGVEVRVVDIAARIMARSGSSPSESLFGVDLERGSEGGEKPLDVMATHTATHFCSHTTLAPRAISSVSKVQRGACPGLAAGCEALKCILFYCCADATKVRASNSRKSIDVTKLLMKSLQIARL